MTEAQKDWSNWRQGSKTGGRQVASFIAVLLGLLCQGPLAAQEEGSGPKAWSSDTGAYRVSYTSTLQPIVINHIHEWILQVEDARGEPVENAVINVQGGMPAHDHGLPTRPQVEYLEAGRYRLEGMRFHMMGVWEVILDIEAGGQKDTLLIPLRL